MLKHFDGGGAVCPGIDVVEPVCQYAHRLEPVGECLAVCAYVHTVGETAEYQYVGA